MPAEVVGVIPARFSSTRLPGKALVEIEGVPMVVRVWRQASQARSLERVIVATDDERIARAVAAAGGEAMMTSPARIKRHRSDRGGRRQSAAEIYLNVQGDLPFIASGRPRRAGRADARRPAKSRWRRWRRRSPMPKSGTIPTR